MHDIPRLSYKGPTRLLTNYGDGEEAMYMRERVFWQSRALLFDPPRLTNLNDLATEIRKTWKKNI